MNAAETASPSPSNLTVAEMPYASSVDGTTPLFVDVGFLKDGKPKPVVAVMHGYNGNRKDVSKDIRDLAARGLFCVAPDMRGRGNSAGKFDSGGLDVHDIVDGILAAMAKHPGEADTRNINIIGYSGGGGNSFSAFVRFPDLFHVVGPFFGISDYGSWYRAHPDQFGKLMDAAIGGSPEKLPQHYAARNSCLAAGNNRATRLHIFWDETEAACPPIMTEHFLEAYHAAGHTNATEHISLKTDPVRWLHGYRTDNPMLERADDLLAKEILSSGPALSLPAKGSLTVCGYVVTRHFQVFIEDGQRGVVKINYDLSGAEPKIEVAENPGNLKVNISLKTPLSKLSYR